MPFPQQWLCSAIETAAGCRAYPASVPEVEGIPYVTYEHTGTAYDRTMDGLINQATATYQVVIYADTYLAVQELARLVQANVDNFTGVVGGVTIAHCHIEDERDGTPVEFAGEGKPTYAKEQTYLIRYFEE
jgi:hypothetical protein